MLLFFPSDPKYQLSPNKKLLDGEDFKPESDRFLLTSMLSAFEII